MKPTKDEVAVAIDTIASIAFIASTHGCCREPVPELIKTLDWLREEFEIQPAPAIINNPIAPNPLVPSPQLFPHDQWQGKVSSACPKCGIKWEVAMLYCCQDSSCPMSPRVTY